MPFTAEGTAVLTGVTKLHGGLTATGNGTIVTETDLCAGTAVGTFTGTISNQTQTKAATKGTKRKQDLLCLMCLFVIYTHAPFEVTAHRTAVLS